MARKLGGLPTYLEGAAVVNKVVHFFCTGLVIEDHRGRELGGLGNSVELGGLGELRDLGGESGARLTTGTLSVRSGATFSD